MNELDKTDRAILAALQEINVAASQQSAAKPILVKVAPDLTFSALDEILELPVIEERRDQFNAEVNDRYNHEDRQERLQLFHARNSAVNGSCDAQLPQNDWRCR